MNKPLSLRVGYAREIITPNFPVGLSGYWDDETRWSEGTADDICITCLAITEGPETILLYTTDVLSVNGAAADLIRTGVTAATGIPGEKQFYAATHSHSAPLLYGDRPDTVRYRAGVLKAAVTAAQSALADRSPAEMLSTVKTLHGMNFVRHYRMADGTYAGSNFGRRIPGPMTHATEGDPRMVLVSFARQDKPDIVMMNWQAHNDDVREVGYNLISSSYVGKVRSAFEQATGMHFAFFMGASGNQNPDSWLESEQHHLDWIAYGTRMAEHAVSALPDLRPVTGGGISTKRVMYEYQVDHSWDHALNQACEVYYVWKTQGRLAGCELGKKYNFSSAYQSQDILRRAVMGPTALVELNAFRIGDMGFVTSPNEVFSTVGLHVRAHSPFDTTFIITGNADYLPCAEAYDYRSYEADTTLFAKGTAEQIADRFVEMLKTLS